MIAESELFNLSALELLCTILVFVWSGFVRSGLGFGGAALSLPLLLLIDDNPLFWLPVIGIHLLVFSALTLIRRLKNVDWSVLGKTWYLVLPGKLAGVFGLLSLPNDWLVIIIYLITMFYALLWLMNLQIHSNKTWLDRTLLVIGGYFSGTSLTGAPLMAAVFANMTERSRLRDTLFILWFFLVSIKLATLSAFGVDLQIISALALLPIAGLGHLVGLKVHEVILHNDQRFRRVIGGVLIAICLIGLASLIPG